MDAWSILWQGPGCIRNTGVNVLGTAWCGGSRDLVASWSRDRGHRDHLDRRTNDFQNLQMCRVQWGSNGCACIE